jgi:hypothetical protein
MVMVMVMMTSWCSVTISSKNRRNMLRRSSTTSGVQHVWHQPTIVPTATASSKLNKQKRQASTQERVQTHKHTNKYTHTHTRTHRRILPVASRSSLQQGPLPRS